MSIWIIDAMYIEMLLRLRCYTFHDQEIHSDIRTRQWSHRPRSNQSSESAEIMFLKASLQAPSSATLPTS